MGNYYDELNEKLTKDSEIIKKNNTVEFEFIIKMINLEYKICSILYGNVRIREQLFGTEVNEKSKRINVDYFDMVFSIAYKNLVSIYTCFKLNSVGLYGQSKIIFRNIFENLIIGKFVMVTNSNKMYKRWKEENEIQISNDIIKKINKPDMNNIKYFWKDLCKWSHGTICSGQLIDHEENYRKDLKASQNILISLLIMNYKFITMKELRTNNYYLKTYAENYWKEYLNSKKEFKELDKDVKEKLTKFEKDVINDFCAKWKI